MSDQVIMKLSVHPSFGADYRIALMRRINDEVFYVHCALRGAGLMDLAEFAWAEGRSSHRHEIEWKREVEVPEALSLCSLLNDTPAMLRINPFDAGWVMLDGTTYTLTVEQSPHEATFFWHSDLPACWSHFEEVVTRLEKWAEL